MRFVAVIPARLASTRLARKALRQIAGKSMVARVYEAVAASKSVAEAVVATDAAEIMEHCRQHGIPARMTSTEHRSGTDRVHEVAASLAADVYINVQGDEPLTRPEHLDLLVSLMRQPGVEVGTLKTVCAAADIANPNAVKVVCDAAGRALYFSRSTIPFDRDRGGQPNPTISAAVADGVPYFKHLGFYAYRKAALERFCSWPESPLERVERLEQLRFLENGIAIQVAETPFDTVGVDTEEDLQRVEQIILGQQTR